MKIQKIIIPAGNYYIGDPALILPKDVWSKFHSKINDTLVEKYEEHNFIIVSLGGDGLYVDSDLFEYAIDSGSISIIPVELIPENDVPLIQEFVRKKTFTNPILFRYLPYEFMSIGSIFFDLSEGQDINYEYESEVENHVYWEEWNDNGIE